MFCQLENLLLLTVFCGRRQETVNTSQRLVLKFPEFFTLYGILKGTKMETEVRSGLETNDHSQSNLEDKITTVKENLQSLGASEPKLDGPDKRKSTPEILVATWMPEDHVIELTRILQGATADRVENRLLHYVVESIEPAGWRAVWRSSAQDAEKLNIQNCSDFIVDVINVSQEKLEAEVKIFEAIQKDAAESDSALEKIKNKEVTVPLMQLYPLTAQENPVVDIATTAEVVEQIRFFYNHVWQAWDLEDDNCHYDHYLITTRLKLYQDIENGIISSAVGSELRSLARKASEVQREIEKIEKCGDDDGDWDQKEVMSLIQLHKQMERLKARFDLLQQPALRELSTPYQPIERCWSVSSFKSNKSNVKLVMDCINIADLSILPKLPELLKSLPQISKDAICQSFPTLQLALDTAVHGDVIVLLPGHHTLQHLGLLSTGGTLVGFGEDVVIEGTKEAGDILMDVSGDFAMQNVTLRPATGQVGIVQHKGTLDLNKIFLEGGLSGIVGLGKTYTKVKNTIVKECTGKALDFREGATAILSKSVFTECNIGLLLEENSKICVHDCTFKKNTSHGILIMWPEGSDVSSLKDIPKEGLLQSLLQEYERSCVEENKEDIGVQLASKPASEGHSLSAIGKNSNSLGSTGSLDSGLEFVE